MPDEKSVTDLALPWAAVMPDGDLHEFLGDLVAAAMHRWHSDPDVPDREVLAMVEQACAQWRTPGQGFRSDGDEVDTRLAEIAAREQAATNGPWAADHWEIHAPTGWIGETCDVSDYPASTANGQFVAHARADIPWLLAEVIRLRAEVQQLGTENQTLEKALGLNEAA